MCKTHWLQNFRLRFLHYDYQHQCWRTMFWNTYCNTKLGHWSNRAMLTVNNNIQLIIYLLYNRKLKLWCGSFITAGVIHRLIYFGGYGPLRVDTAREVNNSKSFMVDEASWVSRKILEINLQLQLLHRRAGLYLDISLKATIGSEYFQFWGWNNEVQMFEPESATWTEPQTQVKKTRIDY